MVARLVATPRDVGWWTSGSVPDARSETDSVIICKPPVSVTVVARGQRSCLGMRVKVPPKAKEDKGSSCRSLEKGKRSDKCDGDERGRGGDEKERKAEKDGVD